MSNLDNLKYTIEINPHPAEQDKYLMIFKPINFELTINADEHQSIIDYAKTVLESK